MCTCICVFEYSCDACKFFIFAPFWLFFFPSPLCPPYLRLPPLPLLRHPLSVALLFIATSSQGSAATKAFSCCHYNYSLHTRAHTHTPTNTRAYAGEEQQRSVFVSACVCACSACAAIHKRVSYFYLTPSPPRPHTYTHTHTHTHPPPSSRSAAAAAAAAAASATAAAAASHICYAEHRQDHSSPSIPLNSQTSTWEPMRGCSLSVPWIFFNSFF